MPTRSEHLEVLHFPVGPLGCNCVIVGNNSSKEALVIDPGGDPEKILQTLDQRQWKVKGILHTHAHFDHFLASGHLRNATEAPLALHKADSFLWDMLEVQCGMFGVPFEPVPPPDQWIEDEQEFELANHKGCALFTPGHTPGSTCFLFESAGVLVSGDTLFQGSIGRTDLWGGDYAAIERSIKLRLYRLDEGLKVIPGHGPETLLGQEMRFNSVIRA